MKAYFGYAALMLAIVMTTAPADAKGCIKGAIVGGVAGHAAHHTFLGAATGCIVGHHLAKKHEQQAPAAGQDSNSAPAATAPAPTKQQ